MTLYLHGLGHFNPENEITNQFLTDLDIGTNDEWIMERVGIRSRRTVLPLDYIRETRNSNLAAAHEARLYTHADTASRAAKMALERAGIDASDVGMLISGSCSPESLSPADACNIAQALEMEVPSFDVNSACTSFNVGLNLLSLMQPEMVPDYVLLVAAESLTTSVDYSDRSASVLWGDGTVAAVLSTKVRSRARIIGNSMHSSPAGAHKVTVGRFSHFEQEGRTVQMFAIKKTVRSLRKLQEEFGGIEGREMHFIGHQANLAMLETVCTHCDIPPDHHHSNVADFGNTAAAGSPSVISERWDAWDDHDDIAVVGVGSGLTWAGYVLRFGEEV